MKMSVSLPDDQVRSLDRYAQDHGLASRSAAVQRAIELLVLDGLQSEYDEAFEEWRASGEDAVWDHVATDGLADDVAGGPVGAWW